MSDTEPTVFVVDDDEALCESLTMLLRSQGLRVRAFNSAEAFLDDYDFDTPGCLVLDLRMRGMNGLDLQAHLASEPRAVPIIMLTGHGDIPLAVRAIRAGALDFLEKPVNDQALVQRIRAALEHDQRTRAARARRHDAQQRLAAPDAARA